MRSLDSESLSIMKLSSRSESRLDPLECESDSLARARLTPEGDTNYFGTLSLGDTLSLLCGSDSSVSDFDSLECTLQNETRARVRLKS